MTTVTPYPTFIYLNRSAGALALSILICHQKLRKCRDNNFPLFSRKRRTSRILFARTRFIRGIMKMAYKT